MHPAYQLLTLCAISIHGFSIEGTARISNCLLACSNETCEEACNRLASAFESYPRINEECAANASLHCTGVNVMMIRHNPGSYMIEQSSSEDSWNAARMSEGSMATFTNLTAGTFYRYRLHRLSKEGVSQPEISNWYSTYAADYQPLEVRHIALSKIEADETNVHQLRAEIMFEPAKDRSCSYNVLSWSGEHSLINFDLKEIEDFRFELTHLTYDQNTTVSVSSSNGDDTKFSNKTTIAFATPSCLEIHDDLSICAPEKVEGLQIKHTHRHGDLYDVLVSWEKPLHEPDNYTIQLDLLQDEEGIHSVSVSGNETEVSFLNLELGPQYEVSIIAESSGGISSISSILSNLFNEQGTGYKFYREILIGLSTLVTIMILIGVICLQRYREKSKHFTMEYTYFESSEKNDPSKKTEKLLRKEYAVENSDVPLIRDKFEIRSDMLKLKCVLGSGAYGIVRLGSLLDDFGIPKDVAVKMLKDSPSAEDIKNFHQEIAMMKSAGQHPNIVSLIGCCTMYNKPLLVVEYCCKGDLQSYLRRIWQNMVSIAFDHRARFRFDSESLADRGTVHLSGTSGGSEPSYQNVCMIANRLYDIQQDVVQSTEQITAGDLLNFARQIATGMEFLSSNRIVHRDLAARNVLVCNDRIVKISDFGLSRDIYQENIYRKQGNGKLPLKWMAIEALTHQIYTTSSDVWSFGILLWEIVTMGALPYPGIPTEIVPKLLKSGYRMERPSNCGVELYNIIFSCWNVRPQSRPTFTELRESLDELLSNYAENKYLNISEILQDQGDDYPVSMEK